MTKYEDASWHSEGDFPDDLPESAAATHIGMLLGWCVLNGYSSDDLKFLAPVAELEKKSPDLTPGAFCLKIDGKFTEDDVSREIHAFLEIYTDADDGEFYDDYEAALAGDLKSIYHVPDTWESYEAVAPAFTAAHNEFKEFMESQG